MDAIYVLRLGHRRSRDKRITTHVCLVARAFGAAGCLIAGDYDPMICSTVDKVCERWGGKFECRFIEDWRDFIRSWKKAKADKGVVVHLTMYGINLPNIISNLRELYMEKDFLVIVGAGKVPRELYYISDYNVAVGNQPHSEVAALAVFLDWLKEGRELEKVFKDAQLRIVPMAKGKKVVFRPEKNFRDS